MLGGGGGCGAVVVAQHGVQHQHQGVLYHCAGGRRGFARAQAPVMGAERGSPLCWSHILNNNTRRALCQATLSCPPSTPPRAHITSYAAIYATALPLQDGYVLQKFDVANHSFAGSGGMVKLDLCVGGGSCVNEL